MNATIVDLLWRFWWTVIKIGMAAVVTGSLIGFLWLAYVAVIGSP